MNAYAALVELVSRVVELEACARLTRAEREELEELRTQPLSEEQVAILRELADKYGNSGKHLH